jgi:hypothetical protein
MLVYRESETGTWEIGFHDPAGDWAPQTSWDTRDDAEQHLHYLNGGVHTPLAMFDVIARRIARGFAAIEAELDPRAPEHDAAFLTLEDAAQAVAAGLFAAGEDQEGKRAWFMSEALPIRAETADA